MTNSSRSKTSKSDDEIGWKYNKLQDPNNSCRVVCKFCNKVTTGGITRAKRHQIGIKGDVAPCPKCPPAIREELWANLQQKTTTKKLEKEMFMFSCGTVDLEEEDEEEELMPRESTLTIGGRSKKAKIGQHKGPMDLYMYQKSEETLKKRKLEKCRQYSIKDSNKELRAETIQYIAQFFYQNGISFNVARSESFKLMLFELIDSIVEEIGEEHVVQLVTDNGSNYVAAAHCIDLILEDIGKISKVKKTIQRAMSLVGFIYNHSSTLNLMRRFTNKTELVRYGVTRFATNFLSLQSVYKQKANLQKMFTSDEWTSSKLARDAKGVKAASTVMAASFWNNVLYTLRVMGPLVTVLRLVDSESKPAMPYIYEAMIKAKDAIKRLQNDDESKYKEIFEIIDNRWKCQLYRPLHAAAHYLNLAVFYSTPNMDLDLRLTSGLMDCIKKMEPDVNFHVFCSSSSSSSPRCSAPRPSAPEKRPQLPLPIFGRKSGKAWGFSPSFLVLEPRNIPLTSADFRICSALLCPSASSFCRWSASRFSGKGMTKNHPFSLNSSWVTLIVLWVLEF
ncbi:hypothetical protein SLEP1_g56476 [Rubroshorea leprosula]|uniref:BED-type domain-containing protein n=1 Tax=Rubroshorea leprosula TaxID=152421 RepID=A0AAV5MJP9_9ROSI|nr:hypothetical protein SLEP1_g56476 [Rubroshorea leprosula]